MPPPTPPTPTTLPTLPTLPTQSGRAKAGMAVWMAVRMAVWMAVWVPVWVAVKAMGMAAAAVIIRTMRRIVASAVAATGYCC